MSVLVLTVETLLSAGFISSGELHFARLCAKDDHPATRPVAELTIAAVARFLGQGHPCVPLSALAGLEVFDPEGLVVGAFPPEAQLREAVRSSASVTVTVLGAVSDEVSTPLVLDGEERLYVSRFYEHERRLAGAIAALVARGAHVETPADDWLSARLDHYFPLVGAEPSDPLQRQAAARAAVSPFTVISGGPGTGKTSTVVKILALLFDAAEHHGAPAPIVSLLAPTGKAAARMMEATTSAFERLSVTETLRRGVQGASTIHRALGVIPNNATRFRRGLEHPLRADVVLVDEASMVDLSLMRHLVEALKPGARLILLGDRHQLASVEAGSVLSELCTELAGADSGDGSDAITVELKRSFRFAEDSGIAALAGYIREGDAVASVAVLRSSRDDLTFHTLTDFVAECAALRSLVVQRYGAALRGDSPVEVLARMADFRVLCAHRRGPYGVETVNEVIRSWLVSAGQLPTASGAHSGPFSGTEFYRGRLILVTENDYGMGLFNGDIGLCWPGEEGRLSVFFPHDESGVREFSPAQLPAHETAFALTIHKSQGSEHEEVAVVMPDPSSQLLTRELVYTGVTRAKKRVHLFGTEESVFAAAGRSVTRYSGLGAAISLRLKGIQAEPSSSSSRRSNT